MKSFEVSSNSFFLVLLSSNEANTVWRIVVLLSLKELIDFVAQEEDREFEDPKDEDGSQVGNLNRLGLIFELEVRIRGK